MHRLSVFLVATGALIAQALPPTLTLEQKEEFLKSAKVIQTHGAKKGVTGTVRATLSDGEITHDASIQSIDEEKARYVTQHGLEMDFRDCYKFNIAAYRLGLLLGLGDVIPPSVERSFQGHKAAWTWWIEDVQMDEVEKRHKNIDAPDHARWAREYQVMKIFDQLIYNTDRNQTNILYDKNWKLWMIDHTRAFRTRKTLLDEKGLERCDRRLLESMKLLKESDVNKELKKWLRPAEISAILVRRDLLVEYFEGPGKSQVYEHVP